MAQARNRKSPTGKEHEAPRGGPTRTDVAPRGRGQSAGPRRRLLNDEARLNRTDQGRETPLGNYEDLARRSS